jgi:hypothetical protein
VRVGIEAPGDDVGVPQFEGPGQAGVVFESPEGRFVRPRGCQGPGEMDFQRVKGRPEVRFEGPGGRTMFDAPGVRFEGPGRGGQCLRPRGCDLKAPVAIDV